MRSDGVVIDDCTVLRRSRKCKEVFASLKTQAVRLLRSPPGSGKTSLATLLLRHQPLLRQCIRVDLSTWNPEIKTLDVFWLERTNDCISNSLDPHLGVPRTIVVDEAQKTYNLSKQHSFWASLKGISALEKQSTSLAQVLLLGVYAVQRSRGLDTVSIANTPITIPNGWSLSFLHLDKPEVTEFFKLYNDSCGEHLRPVVSKKLQFIINHLCGYHVGLLRCAIHRFAESFKDHPCPLTLQEETYFIQCELLLLGACGTIRALPRLDLLSIGDASWISQTALAGPKGLRLVAAPNSDLTRLIQIGMFDYDEESLKVRFSSQLMQTQALRQLFGTAPTFPLSGLEGKPACWIARQIISRMNPDSLCLSKSTTVDNTLLERQYQMTFFA